MLWGGTAVSLCLSQHSEGTGSISLALCQGLLSITPVFGPRYSPKSCTPRVSPQTSIKAQRGSAVLTPLKKSIAAESFTRQKTRPFLSTQKAMMFPSFANSSGRALAQNPLWETKSGHAYFGRVSGLILDGSLEVKPSRRAPLQQHCFLVICKDNSSNYSIGHLNINLHTTGFMHPTLVASVQTASPDLGNVLPTKHRCSFFSCTQQCCCTLRIQCPYLKPNKSN